MSEDEARIVQQEEPKDEVEGHAKRAANAEPGQEGESDDDEVEAHGARKV
jgi:hypothetical protein